MQKSFFPYLKNIHYIPTHKYKKIHQIIEHFPKNSRILISREMDNQLESELENFLTIYPQTKVICIFRKNEDWILSQYKRWVKNGFAGTLEKFVDINNDNGFWKISSFLFLPKINFIKSKTNAHLLLNYQELKSNETSFLKKILAFTNSSCNLNTLNKNVVHRSYSEKQLIFRRKVSNWFTKAENQSEQSLGFFAKRLSLLFSYLVMFFAFLNKNESKLINENYLEDLKQYFEKDWKQTLSNLN